LTSISTADPDFLVGNHGIQFYTFTGKKPNQSGERERTVSDTHGVRHGDSLPLHTVHQQIRSRQA